MTDAVVDYIVRNILKSDVSYDKCFIQKVGLQQIEKESGTASDDNATFDSVRNGFTDTVRKSSLQFLVEI